VATEKPKANTAKPAAAKVAAPAIAAPQPVQKVEPVATPIIATPAAQPVQKAEPVAAPIIAAPAAQPVQKAEPAAAPIIATPAAQPVQKAEPVAATPATAAPVIKPAAPDAPIKEALVIAQAAIQETCENIQKGSDTMTNETQKNFKAGKDAAERIQAVFGDVNARAKDAIEKSTKLAEEATDLTKGNVEALIASSKLAAKGVETLTQEAADYSRRSFESASAALKGFAEVKSPSDFFKLQNDYVRQTFDSFIAESSRASEAVIKLAGEVTEPLTSRYAVAVERVKTLAL
jgi:hypothetical protein